MKKDWRPYALHILKCIKKIMEIVKENDLIEDSMPYDAVLRNLQTMAEATQCLPNNKKQAHPHIPWSKISGFRNVLTHNYLGNIDPLTIKDVIDSELDPLKKAVEAMLA